MKNKIYIMLLISVLIASCSKDSDEPSNEEKYKYLKSITYTDFFIGQKITENLEFTYKDGLLYSESDGAYTYVFEYKNGKMINQGWEKLNIDQNGNLISDIETPPSESLYYTYDSNGIVQTKHVTDGNSSYTLTFEWDGKNNPFYVFWKEYNYYDWGGQGFEPYEMVSCINKHNAKKIFKDNILVTEANYTYDTDGYPTSCAFTEHLGGGETRQGTVTFTYNQ